MEDHLSQVTRSCSVKTKSQCLQQTHRPFFYITHQRVASSQMKVLQNQLWSALVQKSYLVRLIPLESGGKPHLFHPTQIVNTHAKVTVSQAKHVMQCQDVISIQIWANASLLLETHIVQIKLTNSTLKRS